MAKSLIIKNLLENKISLSQAIERLLVISLELNDKDTYNWLKSEKDGYSDEKNYLNIDTFI